MTLLNGALFAAGVACVAVPILIHLLMRRRRKPQPWGAMRFLLEAYRKTRRRLLIERWLLLAARCLLVAAIAFALGRPILGELTGAAGGGRTVYILIDNALASGADSGGATALSRHVAAARRVLGALKDGDRAGIVLLGGPAQPLVLPASANLRALPALLDAVTTTDARCDVAGAFTLLSAAAAQPLPGVAKDRTLVVLLSDLYAGSAALESALPALPAGVRLVASVPASGNVANTAVVDVRPSRPVVVVGGAGAGQPEQAQPVGVVLERSGSAVNGAGVSRVTLRLETRAARAGVEAPIVSANGTAQVSWTPGQRRAVATVALEPVPGAADARALGTALLVALVEGDALPGDDRFRLPMEVRESLRVGMVGPVRLGVGRAQTPDELTNADWLTLALRPREDSTVDLIDLEPGTLDAGRLAGLDAVIVTTPERLGEADWARLRGFVGAPMPANAGPGGASGSGGGGALLIVPPGDVPVHTWTDAMLTGLGVPWTIGREPRLFQPADQARPRLVAGDPPAEEGSPAAQLDLLRALRGELDDLVRPVNVWRALPLSAGAGSSANTESAAAPTAAGASGPRTNAHSAGHVSGRTLLALSDGSPFLLVAGFHQGGGAPGADRAGARSGGVVALFASALDLKWTDLPAKPLMVPLLQELVRQGIGRARAGVWSVAGARVPAPAQATRLVPWAEGASADGALTLDEFGNSLAPIRTAGVFDALDQSGGRRGVLAVNADTPAGRTDALDPAALTAWLTAPAPGGFGWISAAADSSPGSAVEGVGPAATIAEVLSAQTEGRPMGPWLFALALGLALVELVLARRASHAGV
jgi:hypothetical protein